MSDGWDGVRGPRFGEFFDFARPLSRFTVPPPGAPWEVIRGFALSFDGYAAIGPGLGDLFHATFDRWRRTGELPDSLIVLRSVLFLLQRVVRWNEGPVTITVAGTMATTCPSPSEEEVAFARALVEAIRKHLPPTPLQGGRPPGRRRDYDPPEGPSQPPLFEE